MSRHYSEKPVWKQAQVTINKQGWWAIMLTRFWLTTLGPAVNLAAGSRYPYGHFLFFHIAGQLLWVLIYGGLGYIFSEQWQVVSKIAGEFSVASVPLAILAVGIFHLVLRGRK